MRYAFAPIVVFLFCVLTTNAGSTVPLESVGKETDFALLPNQPIFSNDVDVFLGQKRRKSGNGRVWANAYYGDTTLKPKEGGKIDPSLYGFQVGFDLARSHGVFSTFFLNINQSKVKFGEQFGDASSKTDNFLLGYGQFCHWKMSHLAFVVSMGYDKYEISSNTTGTGDGLQVNFFGEFGLDFIFGQWAIRPFYALQYDFLYHGNIGQSPVLCGDWNGHDWNGHGVQQLLGTRMSWKPMHKLELQARTVWVHEMLDNPPPFYRVRFSPVYGINTPAILFHEGNTGRDWAWLGIGVKLECVFNAYFFIDYDALVNSRHATHFGSLGLCLSW